MAKVQHFSGISKRIPFEGFDFYDLFRVTFENSELGRMKRLLPLHEMAVNFGLVSNHPVRKRGPRHSVFLRYFIRYSCAISFGILALFWSVYLLHKIYGAQNGAYQGLGTPRKTEENIALQARKPDTSCCGQSVRLFPVSQTNIARPCIWHPSPGHTLRHCGLHARNSEFSFYFSHTLE